jgi:hypothetical protein
MTGSLILTRQVDFRRGRRGRKRCDSVMAPGQRELPLGRVPRVARLLALAIKLDGLVRQGVIPGYAALARLGHVSTARICQIMNLLQLAPDIQEEILFLPRTERGRDVVQLRHLQPIAAHLEWHKQRPLWRRLLRHDRLIAS